MALNRFQIKITGGEKIEAPDTGKIVGWRIEFYSCQPAPVRLIVNEREVEIAEGLLIPATSQIRLAFTGEKSDTAGVQLVMEKV